MKRHFFAACARVLPIIAIWGMAGCQKDSPPPDPAECWGRQAGGKPARGKLTFCVSGGDARQTTYFSGRDSKPTTCKAAGRVVSRSKDKLSISFDSGSCEDGRKPAAHKMSCLSAEGRSWACEFSKEAKQLPGLSMFFPVTRSD
jgi:hypothetical protein